MKKFIIILFVIIFFSSCTPNIYQVYDKYKQGTNFEHTKIDGSLIQLASLMIPKDEKESYAVLNAINSVDIVHYKGKDDLRFQKEILKSLKKAGYRELKNKQETEQNISIFVKKGLTRVREFHVLSYEEGNVSVFSIEGKFSISDLEKAYKLIKKHKGVKRFINNFDFKER